MSRHDSSPAANPAGVQGASSSPHHRPGGTSSVARANREQTAPRRRLTLFTCQRAPPRPRGAEAADYILYQTITKKQPNYENRMHNSRPGRHFGPIYSAPEATRRPHNTTSRRRSDEGAEPRISSPEPRTLNRSGAPLRSFLAAPRLRRAGAECGCRIRTRSRRRVSPSPLYSGVRVGVRGDFAFCVFAFFIRVRAAGEC